MLPQPAPGAQTPPTPGGGDIESGLARARSVNTEILLDCQERVVKIEQEVGRISANMKAHHAWVLQAVARIEARLSGQGPPNFGPVRRLAARAPPAPPIFFLPQKRLERLARMCLCLPWQIWSGPDGSVFVPESVYPSPQAKKEVRIEELPPERVDPVGRPMSTDNLWGLPLPKPGQRDPLGSPTALLQQHQLTPRISMYDPKAYAGLGSTGDVKPGVGASPAVKKPVPRTPKLQIMGGARSAGSGSSSSSYDSQAVPGTPAPIPMASLEALDDPIEECSQ